VKAANENPLNRTFGLPSLGRKLEGDSPQPGKAFFVREVALSPVTMKLAFVRKLERRDTALRACFGSCRALTTRSSCVHRPKPAG
jgi:hypothetical protein